MEAVMSPAHSQSRAPAQRREAPARTIEEAREAHEKSIATARVAEKWLRGYAAWFDAVLPAGVSPAAFITLLCGVLRKDSKLAEAVVENFESFIIAATECAQLGGIPGKTYHFVPFNNEDTGIPAVTGIVDYKLEIQLALNSGFADTINCECVYAGDYFDWQPTKMRVPEHIIKNKQRANADLVAVYAYGELNGRRVGKCVVLWRDEVMLHKKVARSKKFWEGHWEYYMWQKTAVHVGRRYWGQSPAVRAEIIAANARAIEMGGYYAQLAAGEPDMLVPPKVIPGQRAIANGEPAGETLRTVAAEHDTGHGPGDVKTTPEDVTSGFPAGSVPAQPAARQEEPAAAQAASPGQQDAPDLDGPVTPSTFSTIGSRFTAIHWTGADYRLRRRVVTGILAAGDGQPPLDLSRHKLTEREGLAALAAWDRHAAAALANAEKLPARLQRMYDQLAVSQRDRGDEPGTEAGSDG
jgi:phage RecT family recombinase